MMTHKKQRASPASKSQWQTSFPLQLLASSCTFLGGREVVLVTRRVCTKWRLLPHIQDRLFQAAYGREFEIATADRPGVKDKSWTERYKLRVEIAQRWATGDCRVHLLPGWSKAYTMTNVGKVRACAYRMVTRVVVCVRYKDTGLVAMEHDGRALSVWDVARRHRVAHIVLPHRGYDLMVASATHLYCGTGPAPYFAGLSGVDIYKLVYEDAVAKTRGRLEPDGNLFEKEKERLVFMKIHPTRPLLVTGMSDRIQLWNLGTRQVVWTQNTSLAPCDRLWLTTDKLYVVLHDRQEVSILDMRDGELVKTIPTPRKNVHSVWPDEEKRHGILGISRDRNDCHVRTLFWGDGQQILPSLEHDIKQLGDPGGIQHMEIRGKDIVFSTHSPNGVVARAIRMDADPLAIRTLCTIPIDFFPKRSAAHARIWMDPFCVLLSTGHLLDFSRP